MWSQRCPNRQRFGRAFARPAPQRVEETLPGGRDAVGHAGRLERATADAVQIKEVRPVEQAPHGLVERETAEIPISPI
jgi:hypothetical protein